MQDQLEHLNRSLEVLKKRPVKGKIGSQGNKGDEGLPGVKGGKGTQGTNGEKGTCYLDSIITYWVVVLQLEQHQTY